MLRRGLKLTALATVVVLALTGFSTGRGHGGSGKSRGGSGSSWSGGSHSSSGGGGCSSSKQNHGGGYTGSHHSDYGDDSYDDDSYGSSGGSDTATDSVTGDADVVIVDCAGPGRKAGKRRAAGKADSTVTVRVTSQAPGTNDFSVGVDLLDGGGRLVENVSKSVTLDERETETLTLRMTMPRQAANVYRCANPLATTV
ncbi:hypothetical protein ACFVTY_17155 [Streptomyces sp. NPDC058067]|uniref:hypothetical protein n=1 Tax=Streptomyces sp. NPDC058067 TaxID=3346324 RepID=UPI0036EAB414